uniref:uncharacterized protein LOC105349869 n=1 Tax=Fragaria vesca subsp. vesca TaxID=101020 RepID=UPI0005C90630|nr:PREDICTED: uncharacterized protein LOC105349869 [Fragaria vesca subsp. vesca]
MATKTMNMFLVLVTSTVLAIGVVSAHEKTDSMGLAHEKTDSMRLAARDAITLAVSEISNTQKFINTIPRLKTVETAAMPDETALVSCAVGLIDSLSNAHSALQRMRHLNKATISFIDADVDAWKSAVLSRIASFNNVCQVGLKDVDKTIVVMLNRKLEDVMILASNVIKHVSDLKLN